MDQITTSFVELTTVDSNLTETNQSNESSINLNTSCFPNCEQSNDYSLGIVCSLIVLFVLICCILIIIGRSQHLKRNQQKQKKNDRLYAKPFEDILLNPDEIESNELTEVVRK